MKTIMPKQCSNTDRKWYVIDADGLTLGRLSTKIANILRWKNKLDFAGHVDNWDNVIVLNAWKIKVTWNKLSDKKYYRHSGYMWWLKEISLQDLLEKRPLDVLKFSVRWMLPKNKLRKKMLLRLKLYEGTEHEHSAQKPIEISI